MESKLSFLGGQDDSTCFMDRDGVYWGMDRLEGSVVGVYFTADWCPPCWTFLPRLNKTYEELKEQGKKFEVIFVSLDKNSLAYGIYFKRMGDWLSIPFQDEARRQEIGRHLAVKGIPCFVVLNGQGEIINKNARKIIMSRGAAAYPFEDASCKCSIL